MKTIYLSVSCIYFYSLELAPTGMLAFWLLALFWALAACVAFVADCYHMQHFLNEHKDKYANKKRF